MFKLFNNLFLAKGDDKVDEAALTTQAVLEYECLPVDWCATATLLESMGEVALAREARRIYISGDFRVTKEIARQVKNLNKKLVTGKLKYLWEEEGYKYELVVDSINAVYFLTHQTHQR